MEKHLYYYPNHTAFLSSTDLKNIHNVIYCNNETHVHYDYHDYSKDYLTFEIVESGTIDFGAIMEEQYLSILYSTDNGNTWISITSSLESQVTLGGIRNVGDKILVKGNNERYGRISYFSGTAKVKISGNIMSLIYGDNFRNNTTLSSLETFTNFFASYSELLSAENLILPATTLTENCYNYMFYGCTNLTTAPELPSLNLSYNCYGNMFQGCTSLTSAPELPATTLTNECYSSMFLDCTSLTTAPELPATTLIRNCYWNMFNGCTSLNYIKAMFTTTPSSMYTGNWVSGVAASGTFVKNSAAQWDVTGADGIPTSWAVQTASN